MKLDKAKIVDKLFLFTNKLLIIVSSFNSANDDSGDGLLN